MTARQPRRGRSTLLASAGLTALLIATSGAAAPLDADRQAAFIAGTSNDCRGCDLAGVNLKRRNLAGADLAGANLQDASFHHANLRGANLAGANLQDANLNRADLTSANFQHADLTGALVR